MSTKSEKDTERVINDGNERHCYEMTLRKKVMCLRRSIQIVEQLSEKKISEAFLIKAIQFIDQNQYNDVIHERTSVKLCGYSLCENLLSQIPKQQYRICRATKRVYDLTKLKDFCSAWCLQASDTLRAQITSTPVWCRSRQDFPGNSIRLLPREEVAEEKKENFGEAVQGTTVVTSVETFNLEMEEDSSDSGKDSDDSSSNDDSDELSIPRRSFANKPISIELPATIVPSTPLIITERQPPILGAAPPTPPVMPSSAEQYQAATLTSLPPTQLVINRVRDWITPASLTFLRGDVGPGFVSTSGDMCSDNPPPPESTVSDYVTKVQQFYKKSEKVHLEERKSQENERDSRAMPLVDSVSQMVIRRQILLERIHSTLPRILSTLNINQSFMQESFRDLISTFNLTSKNLSLRPAEWKMASLLLLKLLSWKLAQLQSVTKSETFHSMIRTYYEDVDCFHSFVSELNTENM